MQTDQMQTLRWMRRGEDSVFAVGAVALMIFAIHLMVARPPTPSLLQTRL